MRGDCRRKEKGGRMEAGGGQATSLPVKRKERYEALKLFHFNNYEPELNTAWTDCKFARFAILITIGCPHK